MLSFLVSLPCLSLAASISPLGLVPRTALDVFSPKIISPDSHTIWGIGQTETVVWDASNAPTNISNKASISLSTNPYLTDPKVLAEDFDLRAGQVDVLVPGDVSPGFYHIVLFGDSGNISPTFWIGEPTTA